ncbi:hypothetical protein NQ318_018130 [Aromia moschata]|uniref:HTH CENPB-type domain-containing protein n=1 Tax=Aromia moschata TaxID=1265417 RepID=A0AAV8ZFK1_9CUCU|nr:hypothetical protein NQ318_018130 [Aromia moschata]
MKNTFEYHAHYDTNRVFSKQEEELLVSYLKQAAQLHYGLSLKEVRSLAYQYAQAHNKTYSQAWASEQNAGKSWLRCFRGRYNRELSLRKPEATSLARSTEFNKLSVAMRFVQVWKSRHCLHIS